jgi:DnaJ-class molecular chaperone
VFELIVVVGLLIGAYVLSLKLNPWVKCSKCKNKPRPQGWVFSHAHHTCPRCNGTGREPRWGYKFFRMGPKNGVPPV